MSAKIINGIFHNPSLKPQPKQTAKILIFPGRKTIKTITPKQPER